MPRTSKASHARSRCSRSGVSVSEETYRRADLAADALSVARCSRSPGRLSSSRLDDSCEIAQRCGPCCTHMTRSIPPSSTTAATDAFTHATGSRLRRSSPSVRAPARLTWRMVPRYPAGDLTRSVLHRFRTRRIGSSRSSFPLSRSRHPHIITSVIRKMAVGTVRSQCLSLAVILRPRKRESTRRLFLIHVSCS